MKKYGAPAKAVATAVLGVVAPGAVVQLVERIFDKAKDTAQDQWEAELLRCTQQNAAELARLGNVFELLNGDLAKLCDKAFAFHDQPDDMEDIVRRALAADRGLTDGLRKLDGLCDGMVCVQQQQRQLLAGQEEMLPILRRLDHVYEFFAECFGTGTTQMA